MQETKTTRNEKMHAINYGNNKRLIQLLSVSGIIDAGAFAGNRRVIVEARIYSALSGYGRIYASIWIYHEADCVFYPSGRGMASGGGYHKPSAALSEAIINAGFELSEPIDASGDGAMREAVIAIAQSQGARDLFLTEI